jgi:CheY-like chemotaxis protein
MEKAEFDNLGKPIALIVDDEPLILMDTADIISDEGYAVIEATTADQAFEFLTEHPSLELLFTDVQTPGNLDGFDLARKVADKWPHIRVIVASGAVEPRPDDIPPNVTFIPKPISAELVHKVLKERCALPTPQGS